MEIEVVLGIGEEGRPKACSSQSESAKEHDSGEKTLGEDFGKACSPQTESAKQHNSGEKTLVEDFGQENGVKVSENGEQMILSDDDGSKAKENVIETTNFNGEQRISSDDDGSKATENVVETTNFNDSGAIEDCVMNGVSSLLKLKQDFSDKENLQEEKEINEDEANEDDDNEEEEEEEEHEYHVGDFVWGKIKHHPWWPGQIYDPSDASDLALKIKQKGKLLVAYFGDSTFAWCCASQLKPFAESFKECSKVRNSRVFAGAVEESVQQMGRYIERLLLCDCPEEEKQKLDTPPTPEARNAGIKEGVIVREVRQEMISSLLVGESDDILEDVKSLAETLSFSSLLELEILKRKLSVFYQTKRGYRLTEYHESQPVPGLEGKNNDDGIKGRAKRSSKGEEVKEAEEPVQRSLEKCSGFPDHRLQHRRKQKSIAEILENESAAKVRFEGEPADENVKSGRKKVKRGDRVKGEVEVENVTTTTTTRRARRMSEVSTVEDADPKKVEENGRDKTVSRKRKRTKRDDNDDGSEDREESAHTDVIEKSKASEIDIDSTPLASLRKRVRVDNASNAERNTGSVETATQTPKRERKKSKYFSPDYLSDFSRKKKKTETESSKVSSENQVGEQTIDASEHILAEKEDKLDKPGEPSDDGLGDQEVSEEVSNAVNFLRLGATPKEMRDLIRVAALGTQYPKDSNSRDMVREFMSIYRSFTYHDGTNSKFLGDYNGPDKEREELNETGKPKTKVKERKDKKRKAKQQAEEIEQTGKEENEITKKERKSNKPKSKQQAEEIEEIGTEENEGAKKERKLKKPKSKQKEDEEEEETGKGSKEERKQKKPRYEEEEEIRKEQSEIEKPEKKKKKKKREGKSKEKRETEKEFAGADLFVTFGPGSSLPKKEELIEIYKKFGALEEERTYMYYNNFCARVAFLNVSDGENAFESSQEKCPFVSNSTVNFRLKYPTNESTKEKTVEAVDVAETAMKMEYVKKKLEEMRSLVDESEGGMIEEVKMKLENEMVDLLEKVREF